MLEVKLSEEEAKSGADPAALPELIAAVRECPNLRLLGLMTMPPWSDDPEASRPYFRRLRELARAARAAAAFHGNVARSGDRHRRRRPPACAWARRCSASGRRRDRRVLFAPAAGAHRRGGLCGGAAGGTARRTGAWRSRPPAATWRSITWATTRCMAASTGARWSSPAWWCCTTPCCIISAGAARRSGLHRGVRLQLRRVEPRPGARIVARPRRRRRSDSRYFDYPMLRRVGGARAGGGGAQSGGGARRCSEHAPGARVVEIPHLFAPPALPSPAEAIRFRQRWAWIRQRSCSACSATCGNPSGWSACCRPSRSSAAEMPRAALLVAGQFVSSGPGARGRAAARGPGVVRLPYLPEREFWLAAARRGCLHQPALSGGGRNLRHRHPPDGHRQAGAADRVGRSARAFPKTPASASRRARRNATPCAAHMVLLTSMAEVARAIGQRGAGAHSRRTIGWSQSGSGIGN